MRGTQMRSNSPDGRRKRGSTLVLFTLMLPTLLIPLMGLGIDATMLYIVQAKLSAATDGAALGAGRLLGTLAHPAEIAGGFLGNRPFSRRHHLPHRLPPGPHSQRDGERSAAVFAHLRQVQFSG